MSKEAATEINFTVENLLVRGLDIIITSKKTFQDLKQDIFAKFPDIILDRLEYLSADNQGSMLEGLLSENPSVLISEEPWRNYIDRSIAKLQSMDAKEFHSYTGLYVLLNRILDLRVEVNWHSVFDKLSNATIEVGSKCQGFSTVINWLINSDSENLRKILYKTESKSYPFDLKTELYKRAVDLGVFDVKIARRVRSDSSGSLSSDILSYLFENRHIYSDDVFQDLVTQFSDTKHKWVARYIAINMPMHLVPFLMGIKDDVALNILEKRMEVSED
jgi:hypothetical protein